MIPPTYKPKTKFMQLAIAEAKRARDRGDYAIGAVITQLIGNREVVIASAGNRVKTSGSSIKHVELVNDGSGNKEAPKPRRGGEFAGNGHPQVGRLRRGVLNRSGSRIGG